MSPSWNYFHLKEYLNHAITLVSSERAQSKAHMGLNARQRLSLSGQRGNYIHNIRGYEYIILKMSVPCYSS